MKIKSFDANPAAGLAFLQEQAAHIEAEVYRLEYPQFKYSRLVPLVSDAPEWTKTVIFQAIDVRGELELLGPNSTDVPTVDIAKKQGFHEIKTAALGYTYSLEELNYAFLTNTSLDTERGQAVRDVTEEGLNKMYLLGNKNLGDGGLFASPLISQEVAGSTVVALIAGINANGFQPILDLFANARSQVYITNTNTVHMPNTFALPVTVMELLRRTIVNDANASNITALELLKKNFPDMDWEEDLSLEAAGAGNTKRMMCYKRDKRVVKGHDVMPLKFMAPATADNINYKVPAITRTGGTEWRIPGAAHYVDGI